MSKTAKTYSKLQIALHWYVVLGILFQILFHEAIVRVMAATRAGSAINPSDDLMASIHALVGTSILVAVVIRLWLRFTHGVPAHAPGASDMAVKAAGVVHNLLYLLMLAMVISGMLTFSGVADLGSLHWAINLCLFFLALGHAGAALWNHFVRKDGTLARMRF